MKKILIGFVLVFLAILLYIVGSTSVEKIIINQQIKEFIGHSQLEYEDVVHKRAYYRVNLPNYHPEYSFDPMSQSPIRLSHPGDILVNLVGTFREAPAWINDSLAFFIGGHSALVGNDDALFEAIGFGDVPVIDHILYPNSGYPNIDDTGVYKGTNYWFSEPYTNEFFALRMKNATAGDMQKAVANAQEYYDNRIKGEGGFNYLFIMNKTTKFYCGDVVNRAWSSFTPEGQSKNFNLNKDGVASMQNDMLVSKDAYMYLYYKLDGDIDKYYYI
ncbi:MAG: hypothetical protein LBV55_02585 [Acholeplasmatales bacterium]|jgi:hypothetical protein|nr:hypothetical protein [Acholeplasmatales bacterium]